MLPFIESPKNRNRVAVFVDNSNVYRRLRELHAADPSWIVGYDPLVLAQKLAGNRLLVAVNFYCTAPPNTMLNTTTGKAKHAAQMRYLAAVQELEGVAVKFGELKGSGTEIVEKNLDTQLTANMLTMAAKDQFDAAILVSNDSDYVSALTPTKEDFGKKIELLYFPNRISSSLLQLADIPRKARKSFFKQLPF